MNPGARDEASLSSPNAASPLGGPQGAHAPHPAWKQASLVHLTQLRPTCRASVAWSRSLYQAPRAPVTNDPKLGDLIEISSPVAVAAGSLRSQCWLGHAPSTDSRAGPFLPVPASGGRRRSWAQATLLQPPPLSSHGPLLCLYVFQATDDLILRPLT